VAVYLAGDAQTIQLVANPVKAAQGGINQYLAVHGLSPDGICSARLLQRYSLNLEHAT
jgi:hypothetical protein